MKRFPAFVLLYNILVILWGAFVRASGSGAGCGKHWPLCNGEVLPLSAESTTYIEFAHRVSSGLCLPLVLGLLFWARKNFPKKHRARSLSYWAVALTLIEAAIGAGLVLLELVENNSSLLRAGVIALHLCNTMLLVGSLTLLLRSSSLNIGSKPKETSLSKQAIGLLLLLLLTSASGAVTALGDTLFPANSLLEGISSDFAAGAHILLKLRIIHPFLAISTGFAVFLFALVSPLKEQKSNREEVRKYSKVLLGIIVIQLLFGFANLLALAPVWMQIIHLALANGVWIAAVFLWDSLREQVVK